MSKLKENVPNNDYNCKKVIAPFTFSSPKPLKRLPFVTARNEAVLLNSKIASQSLAMMLLPCSPKGSLWEKPL
jgi:hypothetical protein